MPKALQHNYPDWQDDPHTKDSNGESREVWYGAMRVVSAKRARVLRKRGVPLMPLHAVHTVTVDGDEFGWSQFSKRHEPTTPNGRARYAWFECKDDADNRKARKGGACYQTWLEAERGLRGRKADLQERLEFQREDMQARAYFRKGGKLAAMPAHWTDEQKRHYIQHGYVVEIGHGDADGLVHRRSPPVTLYYNDPTVQPENPLHRPIECAPDNPCQRLDCAECIGL